MSLRKSPSESAPPLAPESAPARDPEQSMSLEQAVRLKALASAAADPEAFDPTLTSAEADERIAALEAMLRREGDSGFVRMPRT